MKKQKKYLAHLITLGAFAISSNTGAVGAFNEATLVALLEENQSAGHLELKSTRKSAESSRLALESTYRPQLELSANFTKNQQDLVPNQFLAEENRAISLSLKKRTSWGSEFETGVNYQHFVIGDYASNFQGTQVPSELFNPRAYASFSMSLINNFLGRIDRASLDSTALNDTLTKVNTRMSLRQLRLNTISRYWEVLRFKQQVGVSQNLLDSAKKQLAIILKRKKRSVADASDVSQGQSLVAQRELDLGELQTQAQELARAMATLVGSAHLHELIDWIEGPLTKEERELIQNRQDAIERCSADILQREEVPTPLSSLQEVREGLLVLKKLKMREVAKRKTSDLKIQALVEGNGVRDSQSSAFSDSLNSNRMNYSIGLQFTIPLGSSEQKSREAERASLALLYQKEVTELDNSIKITHRTVQHSIKKTQSNLRFVNTSVQKLQKRLAEQKKKFRLGRVDLIDLVQEEERITSLKNRKLFLEFLSLQNTVNYAAIFDRWECQELSFLKAIQ